MKRGKQTCEIEHSQQRPPGETENDDVEEECMMVPKISRNTYVRLQAKLKDIGKNNEA